MSGAVVVALVVSLPFVIILATRRVLRRLAVRNAVRRPRESALVIAGSLLGTALMTASFVVGDTLTASIRATAYSQLGPIDEVVSAIGSETTVQLHDRLDGFTDVNVDGVLPITTLSVAAATVDANGKAITAAPTAQLVETDFDAASKFGGDRSAAGLAGSGPDDGEAVVVEGLANRLGIGVGDHFRAFAFGRSVQLEVARVIAQRGVAGYWRGREVVSYNAFVQPGTIAALAQGMTAGATARQRLAGGARGDLPSTSFLVSNRGGVEGGAGLTDAVVKTLTQRLSGVRSSITSVKSDLLDAAQDAGDSLQQFYQGIGFFAVAAGILLLINIFTMLADERKSELGMMRAMGLRRRSLVAAFASEGWLYAIVACTLGTVVGVAIGRLVIEGASRISADGNPDLRAPIEFHFDPSSLQSGFAIGLVIAMLTVLGASIGTSRFNIIAAIRDLERPRAQHGWRRVVVGGLLVAVGVPMTIGGFRDAEGLPLLVGPAIASLGIGLVLTRVVARRVAVTALCSFVIAWGVVAVPIAIGLGADPEIPVFFLQGIELVIPAVLLVSEYQNEIGHALSRLSGRKLAVRLGLAYPLARRQRTALTLGQFSIVVFILTYITVFSHMFQGQTETFTKDLGGDYNVVIDSNPIDVAALRAAQGVGTAAPLIRKQALVTPESTGDETVWYMSGIDESFLSATPPRLVDTGDYPTQAAAYRALIANDDFAIVDDRFLSRAGPPSSPVGIGDTMLVKDPTSGGSKRLKIIARSSTDLLANGALTSARAMREMYGENAVPTRAYVDAADPDALVAAVEARDFDRGAQAVTIEVKVNEALAQQGRFFDLIRAFLSLGLVIGVAGIGVIMVRAVRERRRQVGVLRALGFPANSVSNAFAIEAGFVALEGIVVGVALGLVSTWTITLTDNFGSGLAFSVPVVAIGVLVLGTLVGSLIATVGPARSAAKIQPAVALRITD